MDRGAIAAIAALDDDVRRALYEYVRGVGEPVTREAAAAAVGISRKLAAFHLDKLVESGLLSSGFGAARARRVGRAPRLYEPAGSDIAVRLPERTPEVLAEVLIDAVTEARTGESGRDATLRVARRHGVELGTAARRQHARPGRLGAERAFRLAAGVLEGQGFEPYEDGPALRLRNCPFHALVSRAPEFVCGINAEYLAGVVTGLGADGCLAAELDPRPGECCVEIRRARDA